MNGFTPGRRPSPRQAATLPGVHRNPAPGEGTLTSVVTTLVGTCARTGVVPLELTTQSTHRQVQVQVGTLEDLNRLVRELDVPGPPTIDQHEDLGVTVTHSYARVANWSVRLQHVTRAPTAPHPGG